MATETFLVPNLSTPQKLRAQDTQQNTVTVDRSIFPDGIKTSGQHPPIDDQVKAFEDFPVSITGHTVWKPEEYAANRDAWVHRFTSDELSELDAAATAFVASGDRLVAITKVWPFSGSWKTMVDDLTEQLQATPIIWLSSGCPGRHLERQRFCPSPRNTC